MTEPAPLPDQRLASIDAYRGFVMLLMMAEVLHLEAVAQTQAGSGWWGWLAALQQHSLWTGCTLHDIIQPSFSFLVGVVLPFSLAGRWRPGEPVARLAGHALRRGLILVLLGVFLRSLGQARTDWTFEDTLTQIGLGYPWLVGCALCRRRTQWTVFAVILLGYWAAWALYPVPGPDFDYTSLNVPPDWNERATGLGAHWNMNANLGGAVDRYLLNLFPRAEPFIGHPEGYVTLSFIPTLGTMILGLLAGGWLRAGWSDRERVQRLVLVGAAGLILGSALHFGGICPVVKKIWTPAWTLFSGGLCCLLLAAFYAAIEGRGARWAFALIVIGSNSIAAYCLAHLIEGFVAASLQTHLGAGFFAVLGEPYAPVLRGAAVLMVYWLILLWLYRRRLFLKV